MNLGAIPPVGWPQLKDTSARFEAEAYLRWSLAKLRRSDVV